MQRRGTRRSGGSNPLPKEQSNTAGNTQSTQLRRKRWNCILVVRKGRARQQIINKKTQQYEIQEFNHNTNYQLRYSVAVYERNYRKQCLDIHFCSVVHNIPLLLLLYKQAQKGAAEGNKERIPRMQRITNNPAKRRDYLFGFE